MQKAILMITITIQIPVPPMPPAPAGAEHECCNYDCGNCLALDDGEECVCVQSISYSLLCRWFRAAVLPLDKELKTALKMRTGPHYRPKGANLCQTIENIIT